MPKAMPPFDRCSRLGAYLLLVFVAGCGSTSNSPPKLTKKQAKAPPRNTTQELAPLTPRERALVPQLRKDVEHLSQSIGERNTDKHWELAEAADWLSQELEQAGYTVERQGYEVPGHEALAINLAVQLPGGTRGDELVVVGAHYDTAAGSPGADDNASGVAAVLALARHKLGFPYQRAVRYVFFSHEEPPFFQTPDMGSLRYAKGVAARGEKVAAMLSIESIGFYSDEPNSQAYPRSVARRLSERHSTTGNFLAVVGDTESAELVKKTTQWLTHFGSLPVQGAALPAKLPGVGFSDHWSFRQMGFPAVMITDTALFRNPHYHKSKDLPETLDYERMARAVAALGEVVRELAGGIDKESARQAGRSKGGSLGSAP